MGWGPVLTPCPLSETADVSLQLSKLLEITWCGSLNVVMKTGFLATRPNNGPTHEQRVLIAYGQNILKVLLTYTAGLEGLEGLVVLEVKSLV